MKKAVFAILCLALSVGCSKGSSSSGGGGGTPGATSDNKSGLDPALESKPWCMNQSAQGGTYQVRYVFNPDGSLTADLYQANTDGSRGSALGNFTGTYTMNGNVMTITMQGQPAETATLTNWNASEVDVNGSDGSSYVLKTCE